jgi:antitoxin (DNA-binding transcriptional repressor) of toxin-antitoxin stability system
VVRARSLSAKSGARHCSCREGNIQNILKLIPLSEAKAHLSQYGRLCHDEPVIVTINGVPSFQLVPLEANDDLIDRSLEHHPSFRKTLEARLRERSITARDALKRL